MLRRTNPRELHRTLRAQEAFARATGLLPPTDPHRMDAAFADFPEPHDRSDPRMFRFNQLPRNRRHDWVVSMAGFPEATITLLCRHVQRFAPRVHFVDCLAAAVYLHTSPTYDQLAIIMGTTFVQEVQDERRWRERVKAVFDTCEAHPLDRLNSRRPDVDADLFPHAVGIVDGVPMFLNAGNDYYNGKKKRKYLSMQVIVDMDGNPMWSGPPLAGRVHDSTALERIGDFPHGEEELFLADKAYVSNGHCLTQYKREKHKNLREREMLFNIALAHQRAKVERFFSTLQRHACMQRCRGTTRGAASGVWYTLWNLVILDVKTPPAQVRVDALEPCACGGFAKLPKRPKRATEMERETLTSQFWTTRQFIAEICVPKPSQHAKRGAPRIGRTERRLNKLHRTTRTKTTVR
jgi:hypothetical protein